MGMLVALFMGTLNGSFGPLWCIALRGIVSRPWNGLLGKFWRRKTFLICEIFCFVSICTWRVHIGFERHGLCWRWWRIPCGSGKPGVVEELGRVGGHPGLQVGEVAWPAVDLLQQVGGLQGGGSRQRSWDQAEACLFLTRQVLRHRILQVPHWIWVLIRGQGGWVSMVGGGRGGGRGCWLTPGLWVSAFRSVGFMWGRRA